MNYTILWFDDEPKNITLIEKELKVCVKGNHKQDLIIRPHKTFGDEDQFMELVRDPDINLIVSDLNLLNNKKGNELITNIRKNEIFLDVLLYSANVKQLIAATETPNYLEGIYRYALEGDLDGLRQKIEKVIFQNVWKNNYAIRIHELQNIKP